MKNVECTNDVQISLKHIMIREYKAASKLLSKYKGCNLKNKKHHERHTNVQFRA